MIRVSGFRVQSSGLRVNGLGFRAVWEYLEFGCWVWGVGFWDLGFGISVLSFGSEDLRERVEGVGFI
jgi:hypothetical protein